MDNTNATKLSEAERIAEAAKDRRELLELAIEDVPQACIDLMCVVVDGDPEKRQASFWIATAFNYAYKYQKRLREYAKERDENRKRKENTELFHKYIALSPPKSAKELLTLMQRFGIAEQISIPENEDATKNVA